MYTSYTGEQSQVIVHVDVGTQVRRVFYPIRPVGLRKQPA